MPIENSESEISLSMNSSRGRDLRCGGRNPFNFVVKMTIFYFFGGVWFLPKFEPAVFEYATSPRVGFDFYQNFSFRSIRRGVGTCDAEAGTLLISSTNMTIFYFFGGGSGFCLNSNPPCSNTRRVRESDLIFSKLELSLNSARVGSCDVEAGTLLISSSKMTIFSFFWGGVWFLPKFEPAVFEYATNPRVGFDFYQNFSFRSIRGGVGCCDAEAGTLLISSSKMTIFSFFGGVWFLPKFEPPVFEYATSPRVGFDFLSKLQLRSLNFGEGSGEPAVFEYGRPEPFR